MMQAFARSNLCLTQSGISRIYSLASGEEAEDLMPFENDEFMFPILQEMSDAIEEVDQAYYKPKGQNSIHARKGCGTSRSAHYVRLQKQLELLKAGQKNGSNLLEYGYVLENNVEELLDLEEEEEVAEDEMDEDDEIALQGNAPTIPGAHRTYTPRQKYTKKAYMDAIKELKSKQGMITKNQKIMNKIAQDNFQSLCAKSIVSYLQQLGLGVSKMVASNNVADIIWDRLCFPRMSKKSSSYRATLIREWGDDYMATRKLPEHRQGKHVKTATVLTDENVQRQLRDYLRGLPDQKRNPKEFQEALNGFILDSIPGAKSTISLETARRWMHFLGFSPARTSKDYYTDDHNRDDVVQYRNEEFLPQMMAYIKRMAHYEGDHMEIEKGPENTNEDQVVLITHDESSFFANDGAPMIWMEGRKRHLKPKTNGLSLMISGFMCPCHGFMEHNGVKSYLEFAPGKNRDGWFTNDDLIVQLNECFDMKEFGVTLKRELERNVTILLLA